VKYTSLLLILCAVFLADPVSGQSADEIVQKHIAAIGGADNWLKIHSIRKNCTRNSRGVEIPVTVTIVQGKAYRNESTVNGMTNYTIITDKAGWSYNARGGLKADPIPDDVIKQAKDLLDIQGPLIDYKAKDNKIVSLGKDDVEGTECYKLKVTFPWGKEETVYIDASNYYLVRTVDKIKTGGKERLATATYGDYERLPEGIIYPMSVDGGGSLTIKKVEINQQIDEKDFVPADTK
jgi:hypothetical protein